MAKNVWIASPGKLNVHLEVNEKRSDGFHSIRSIFQMVSFGDELVASSLKNEGACEIHGDFAFPVRDNTIYRAVEVFRRVTGISDGVAFEVTKRIPTGAGMGGGSSNAAAALIALDMLFETSLPYDRLSDMGAEIGSDVPFFCTAPAAWVTGRGEVVRRIPARGDLYIVLVFPGIHVGTAEAYGWVDAARSGGDLMQEETAQPAELLIESYVSGAADGWKFSNTFFSVLRMRYPVLEEIRQVLYENGAAFANMSGSGSAMYGVFEARHEAERAVNSLDRRHQAAVITKMLDRLPNAVLQ